MRGKIVEITAFPADFSFVSVRNVLRSARFVLDCRLYGYT
jgi:hypothetical protein